MTQQQWAAFCDFKEEFSRKVQEWNSAAPELKDLQKLAAEQTKTPLYSFDLPVVYNKSLDDVSINDDIKLIVIGDNPGKDEQLFKNSRYLVGQAGKIAEGYFKRNPELEIDFRKNVIILNKTPIHSAKTNQLKIIIKQGGQSVANLIKESQIWFAKKTAELHSKLGTELWLVGYSELKPKKIFDEYRKTLKSCCDEKAWNKVYVFQHFSMNRFSIDLCDFIKNNHKENQLLKDNIHELGILHRNEIFVD
ncbi:MAG: hypothetical protein J6X84_04015 [Treponema sp.]|nr:hypothetical protein [Treponema sp.]